MGKIPGGVFTRKFAAIALGTIGRTVAAPVAAVCQPRAAVNGGAAGGVVAG